MKKRNVRHPQKQPHSDAYESKRIPMPGLDRAGARRDRGPAHHHWARDGEFGVGGGEGAVITRRHTFV
jgi:hypothetical protein